MKKEILYQSDLVTYWLIDDQVLFCKWTEGENFTTDNFKSCIKKMADLVLEHHLRFILDDSTLVSYPIEPTLQTWTVELFLSVFESSKLKKYALVMPKELISSLSNEQIMDELIETNQNTHHETTMFSSTEEAWKWLGFENITLE